MDTENTILKLNNYNYYTNNVEYSNLFKSLSSAGTNKDFYDSIKSLWEKNLLSVLIEMNPSDTNNFLKTLQKNSKKRPHEKISPNLKISTFNSLSNFNELIIIEKPLSDKDILPIIKQTDTFQELGITHVNLPMIFKDKAEILYNGRFCEDNYLELIFSNNKFKQPTFSHEMFHYFDALLAKNNDFKNFDNKISKHVSDLYEYIHEDQNLKDLGSPLKTILQKLPKFYNFIVNFDNLPNTNNDKDFSQKYINNYLNIDINKYNDFNSFFSDVLKLKLETIEKQVALISPKDQDRETTEHNRRRFNEYTLQKCAKDLYDYHHGKTTKSIYSTMSETLALISNCQSEERHYIYEKMARAFEMNAVKDENLLLKNMGSSVEEKNAYPLGHEKIYYVNKLNAIIKEELAPFINQANILTNNQTSNNSNDVFDKIFKLRELYLNNPKSESSLKIK
jgi:hypothetical protein